MRACDNPFRTERLLRLHYRFFQTDWPGVLARLERMRYRAALVGPHGSGKTTLLEDLWERLREKSFGTRFIRLDAEHRSLESGFVRTLFAGVGCNDIILLDGAEQMNPIAWHWFRWRSRKARGLIITTHHSGRLPVLLECRTSAALLAQIAGEILDLEPDAIRATAELLFEKHRGNLRNALWEWYDLVV
jgi:hypothetical protein